MQCFTEFTTTIFQYKFLIYYWYYHHQTWHVQEKTSDTTLETSIIEDDISGREKLFKNFIYNAFV